MSESFRNQLTAAKMITASALERTESRGGHYRTDYPNPSKSWEHRTYMTLKQADAIMAKVVAKHSGDEDQD